MTSFQQGRILTHQESTNSGADPVAQEGVAEPVDIALIGSEDHVRTRIATLEAAGMTELLAKVQGSAEECSRTRAFLTNL
jgi:hypothetical protein